MINSGDYVVSLLTNGREMISNGKIEIEIPRSSLRWVTRPMNDATSKELYRLRAELLSFPKK
jgi:hypothetical protein